MKYFFRTILLGTFAFCFWQSSHAQMFDFSNDNLPFMGTPQLNGFYQAPMAQEANGLASIGVPLFAVNGNGVSDKVALSYNSQGIRVDENASRVGLGWNLVAGGSITRVVCGIPDDDPAKGILRPGGLALIGPESDGIMAGIYKGEYDGEFDYYIIQTGNLNAKFFYDGTQFYCMPANGIKIEKGTFLGIDQSFKVTDQQGLVYYFTIQEKISISNNQVNLSVTDRTYSWLLTKIIAPNQSTITYEYLSEKSYWVFSGKSERATHVKHPTFLDIENLQGDVITNGSYVVTNLWQLYKVHPISQINWEYGQIVFEYAPTSRIDIPGDNAVTSIYQKNALGLICKRYNFSYTHGSRMVLQSVQEVLFESGALPPYQFEYHPGVLPPIGSFSQDRYGYYNAEVADGMSGVSLAPGPHPTMLPQVSYSWRAPGNAASYTETLPGAQRNPSPAHIQFGMLQKIVFPTGAQRTFEFEPNLFTKTGETTEQMGPGVRIKKVIDDDGNGNKKITKYTYQNGVFYDIKRNLVFESSHPSYASGWVGGNLHSSFQRQRVIYRFSNQGNLLPGLLPSQVTYGKVIKEELDELGNNLNGMVENEYYIAPLQFYNEPVFGSTTTRQTAILLSRHFFYGTLLQSTVKAKIPGGYKTVKEVKYEYNFDEPAQNTVFAMYARPINPYHTVPIMYGKYSLSTLSNGTHEIGIHKYFYCSQPFYLKKVTTKEWGTSGTNFNQSEIEYTYESPTNNKHFLPVSIKQTYADGTIVQKYIKRASDFSGVGSSSDQLLAIEQLKANNQWGVEIESYSIKNEGTSNPILLEASLNEYKKQSPSNSLVIPHKSYQLKQRVNVSSFIPSLASAGNFTKSAAYEPLAEILASSAQGNVVSSKSRLALGSLLLSPNNELVLAKVQNAKHTEIAYVGFELFEGAVQSGITDYGNFSVIHGGSPSTFTQAFAGNIALPLGTGIVLKSNAKLSLITGKKYQLYFWAKEGTPQVVINGSTQTGTILQSNLGWNLMAYNFTATGNSIEISGPGVIDEVKLMPALCEWSSMVYDSYGRIIAESDNNHNYNFYQYDNYGRLWRVYDIDKNLLKQNSYLLQQSQN